MMQVPKKDRVAERESVGAESSMSQNFKLC